MFESTDSTPNYVTIHLTGSDADGDLLDFVVTRVPSHGILQLESTLDPAAEKIHIKNATFRCWETYSRYRLLWWPAQSSNTAVSIGIKAFDGITYSAEATVEIAVQSIDGVPAAVATNYSTNEDTALSNLTLFALDIDSTFVSLFVTELPTHGKLFDSNNTEIATAYSPWDVVQPIEQFASNVLAVSTFYPVGDDAGNGYASWHAFQILGPQDAPNTHADSVLTWSHTTILGDTRGIQTGGDDVLSFAHDTWASYLSEGFTEFIEVWCDIYVFRKHSFLL